SRPGQWRDRWMEQTVKSRRDACDSASVPTGLLIHGKTATRHWHGGLKAAVPDGTENRLPRSFKNAASSSGNGKNPIALDLFWTGVILVIRGISIPGAARPDSPDCRR